MHYIFHMYVSYYCGEVSQFTLYVTLYTGKCENPPAKVFGYMSELKSLHLRDLVKYLINNLFTSTSKSMVYVCLYHMNGDNYSCGA